MIEARQFFISAIFAAAALFSLSIDARASSEPERTVELVMLEQVLCEWCEAWNQEVGAIYSQSWEGTAAPLRRVDIHDERPADLVNLPGTRFTPTFVLMIDGKEAGRITGYPGEDFFWGLLAGILRDAGITEPNL